MILPLLAGLALGQGQTVDPRQREERTVFQTGSPYSGRINLRADVAIVYGFDPKMPERVRSWREKGYRIHLMTGVAWGEYQDYYYGRWDGQNHEDEAQTRKNGEKVGHGRDVYYMSPGANYGKYLAEGVRRALEAGVEAVHLEEPEFWWFGGYGEGFKREWRSYYQEDWQDPESSPDARWRAAKLMYFLYRRALQQVFDDVQAFNKKRGTQVRCYVPTHSLINYAHWGIVSPQSSLARLNGCDGYIAQVWTGTAREPNFYQGVKKERTFETAYLEYGAMQNLVRSTGRRVWYLADPIEDNPNHDWGDYRRNYHSTLVASLLQPEVSQFEVMPWPERIFNDRYPSETDPKVRVEIPPAYETELQVVINALKDMKQRDVKWECGSDGVGVLVSDSLMFHRGGPSASDGEMGHFYGLALPFVKRGMPVQPVQLENVTLPGYLKGFRVLLLTYEGMKPLSPEVHDSLAKWVRAGGTLFFVDDDRDPFKSVREWWNASKPSYSTPRLHLFQRLGIKDVEGVQRAGKGRLVYLRRSPNDLSRSNVGSKWLADQVKAHAPNLKWSEASAFVLQRGPYVIAAGLDETDLPLKSLEGEFIDLFDPALPVQTRIELKPSSRFFLVDLRKFRGRVIAAAGYVHPMQASPRLWRGTVEGISETPGVVLMRASAPPREVRLDGKPVNDLSFDAKRGLLWIRFTNASKPQELSVLFGM